MLPETAKPNAEKVKNIPLKLLGKHSREAKNNENLEIKFTTPKFLKFRPFFLRILNVILVLCCSNETPAKFYGLLPEKVRLYLFLQSSTSAKSFYV